MVRHVLLMSAALLQLLLSQSMLCADGFWVFGSASTVGRGENVMLKVQSAA